ncbi:MAG TPA: M13 family metallopeptidase [Candidatus Saccharimonadales bacterium]|nr:M13 family metallopeptidase [Candidatus Saccharimonadales bacterium]
MRRLPATLPVLLLMLLAAYFASPAGSAPAVNAGMQQRLDAKQIADSVTSTMDRSADPCQDFYRYACGGWLATSKIPADKATWGRGFSEIAERNRTVLREILEDAAKHPDGDANRARVGNFYSACMNEEAVDAAGAKPLDPLLERIDAVTGENALMAMAGSLQKIDVHTLLSMEFIPDFGDPTLNILHVGQGGLGLPDRSYYFPKDDNGKAILADYEKHVARMLGFTGEPAETAAKDAKAIVAFETELAKVSVPREDLRDPDKTYHKIDIAGLEGLTPGLSWGDFLKSAGYPGIKDINVMTPDFFKGLKPILDNAGDGVLKAYLRWHLIDDTSNLLSKEIVDANFDFFGKRLMGQEQIEDRWKRCVRATDNALGEALGQAYVDRMFAGDSKAMALEMIKDIESAFQDQLPGLSWMDATTRARAIEKMKAVYNKIGYPDKWRDYSSLTIKPNDYFGNSLAAREFEFDRNASKVGKKVDRTEWFMTPPTVNAYYNPLFNEMVFPAGIMQRPFFNKDFPAAMNYGGMGMAMGHELTHGFDDQGRKFDKEGRKREWWEAPAVEKFDKAAACVKNLYDGFEIQGEHLNGQLTLGENIADFGGIREAYNGYKKWEGRHGVPESPVPGLTSDQLFFVGFAQSWCTLSKPEFEKMMVKVNPHSPPKFRVNAPLSNFDTFAETFKCEKGTPMHPDKVCEVW